MEGDKLFEVRKNDRDYQVWDVLVMYRWDPVRKELDTKSMELDVVYMHTWMGIKPGWCVMGIQIKKKEK